MLHRLKPWLIGLLLLSGLIIAVVHHSEIVQFTELASQARPHWICIGVILQIGTYFCAATAWAVALHHERVKISWLSLAPLAVAKLFSDQAMPTGGMSGSAFLVAALRHRGTSQTACLAALVLGMLSAYAADLLAAALSVALIWRFQKLQPWILVVAALFALMAVAIPSATLALQRWGKQRLPAWLQRNPLLNKFLDLLGDAPVQLLRTPSVLCPAIAGQCGVILLDAATLWIMLLAVGQDVSFGIALPGFFIAAMVAMIGPIPLGLGTFEATCVTVLHLLGVPAAPALTATLLYRGLSMWIPMVPGMWIARRELART